MKPTPGGKMLLVGIGTALLSTVYTAANDPHQWNEVWMAGDFSTILRTVIGQVIPVILAYAVRSPIEKGVANSVNGSTMGSGPESQT